MEEIGNNRLNLNQEPQKPTAGVARNLKRDYHRSTETQKKSNKILCFRASVVAIPALFRRESSPQRVFRYYPRNHELQQIIGPAGF